VTSGLVAECLNALCALASRNEVILMCVPGHCGIIGNEEADNLQGKEQLRHYLVQSRLLEYQSIQQEGLLRTGLGANFLPSGIIYHVTDMVNALLVDHVRKEPKAYLH
jgi:hypothetical protein